MKLVTVPNLICLLRIALTVPIVVLLAEGRYGETLAKVVGVAALVYAAAIAIDGDLAPGSIDKGGMDEMEMDEMEMDEMEMDEMEMDDPMALPS